jgi:hypothetical protein
MNATKSKLPSEGTDGQRERLDIMCCASRRVGADHDYTGEDNFAECLRSWTRYGQFPFLTIATS